MKAEKPHKGAINNWKRYEHGDKVFIWGEFVDHPRFAGFYGNTSYIVSHAEATGEIETLNSRYTLVGPELTREFEKEYRES
ncbi:hypothetical protein [Bradyrhizobium barranii]